MSAPLPGGRRPPSHAAYYVALGGCVLLLILLTCYFFYFCLSRIVELSECESLTAPTCRTTPRPQTYPVQPVVRSGATTIANLCKMPASELAEQSQVDSETSLSCETTYLSGTAEVASNDGASPAKSNEGRHLGR